MRILAIGDPHGKLPKNLSKIVKKNKIDVIVCVGDIPFTPKNPQLEESWLGIKVRANKSYKKMVDKLCSYKLPVLTLRGNMYLDGTGARLTRRIFRKHKNLFHKRIGKKNIHGQDFIFLDAMFKFKPFLDFRKKIRKFCKKSKNPIIISHVPPLNCVDKIKSGKHVGSKFLLKLIKKYKPRYVLCGHIHEAKGMKKVGRTTIINLGSHGSYKVIKIIC